MSLARGKAEYRRLRIVQLLGEDPHEPCNIFILADALADLGEDVRVDRMVELAEWLAGAGLVKIVAEGPPMSVRLTARGQRLAEDRIVVRGVALPTP